MLVEAKTEAVLAETVTALPTMSFDVPVRIRADAQCVSLASGSSPSDGIEFSYVSVDSCDGTDSQVFTFRPDGKPASRQLDKCLGLKQRFYPCADKNVRQFFFDAIDGAIRAIERFMSDLFTGAGPAVAAQPLRSRWHAPSVRPFR